MSERNPCSDPITSLKTHSTPSVTPSPLLRRMVGMNSFTGNKAGVDALGRYTAEVFAPLGFAPEFIPSVNPGYGDHLVLTRPGRSRRRACASTAPVGPPPRSRSVSRTSKFAGERPTGVSSMRMTAS